MKDLNPGVLKNFENKWVALSSDNSKVLYSSSSIKELEEKLEAENIENADILYVMPFNKVYAPACRS